MLNRDKSGSDPAFDGVPTGLCMALAHNVDAMRYFASLTERQRRRVVDMTHGISSKSEMRSFVDSLAKQKVEFPGDTPSPQQKPAVF